ncbi:acylphosphatase [Elioraea thermophila]|uniref:acylphosphatase n=1 Tax=Elioraea thermophila TaxID=2185104 RepID=UPI000DF337FC|nr:acylphosphatase [Elioraea thermophila]
MKTVRILVSGRVQGVGFRAFAVREATRLGLDGWVRNLPDGRVEAVAQGGEDAVAQFVCALRRGPVAARVNEVVVEETEATVPPGFVQRG